MFSYTLIDHPAGRAHPFSMSLKLHIRSIREARGLTLETVAGRVGISTAHLSGVERGIKNLNNSLIERISVALGVQPDALISGGDDTPEAEARENLRSAIQALTTADSLTKVADYAEMVGISEQAPKQTR